MPEHSPVSRQLRVSFYVFVVLLVTFLALTARMTMTYFLSILMGGILALLTRKFYLYLRNRRIGEKTSAGIVLTAVLFLIIGPLGAFGTIAVGQGISLGQHLAQQEDFSISSVLDRVSRFSPVQRMGIDRNEVEKRAKAAVQVGGAKISTELVSILGNLPDKILQIVLALVTCFFLLIDGPRFLLWVNDKLPIDRDVRRHLYESFSGTAVSVIWATLAAAGIQAAMIFGAFLALGIPGAFLAGGATFIFAWIPILGSVPVWGGAAIYLFMNGSPVKAIIMIVLGAGPISIADNFVRALVLKGRGDMHPLVSLVAIFGGIEMFGLFGVFFGPIIMAVLLAILEAWPQMLSRFVRNDATNGSPITPELIDPNPKVS